ncbi:MAG: DUF2325 domain-containing protein [Desulfobacterales bacterium]|nr:DUF2325 domain-containing protein [Desulfobacterales bacterium]
MFDHKENKQNKSDSIFNPVWAVSMDLKCPLTGVCLTTVEQGRILKKTGIDLKNVTPYHIHNCFMSHLSNENRVSIKANHYLKHKFQSSLDQFSEINEEELAESWSVSLKSGDIAGILYVIASRKEISRSLIFSIYGELHMLGHANMSDVMKARRALEMEKKVNRKMAACLNMEKLRLKEVKRQNKSLKKLLDSTELKLHRLSKQADNSSKDGKWLQSLKKENIQLKNIIDAIEKQNCNLEKQTQRLEREKRSLQIEKFELKSSNEIIVKELDGFITQVSSFRECGKRCEESCPEYHLCEKRVLIVGGIIKMKQFYRKLIESKGGVFEYHDGYMKNGNKNLGDSISRSDIILCPVNCNSYGACDRTKKLCKKLNKPVKMLSGSSLNTIFNALSESITSQN